MKKTLEVLNRLRSNKIISDYAIGGAMGALEGRVYDKSVFRATQRALSYPEKVRQVVAMQARIAPILAARGRIIKPWTLDE